MCIEYGRTPIDISTYLPLRLRPLDAFFVPRVGVLLLLFLVLFFVVIISIDSTIAVTTSII